MYLDNKNAFNPEDDYNKYEPLIDAEECKWLCYSPDFQELAECVDNVLDYDETEWTEECSKKAQQCLDECKPANEKIEEALQKRYPGKDRNLRKLKKKMRNLAKHEFGTADLENLETIQYCQSKDFFFRIS